MKKKGFTLIELLAVIVILAIIALIATPLVLKYIEYSKEKSAKLSAQTYAEAVEKEYVSKLTHNEKMPNKEYTIKELYELGVKVKGDKPNGDSDTVTLQNGNVIKYYLTINGYIIKYENGDVTIESEKGSDISNNGDLLDYTVKFMVDGNTYHIVSVTEGQSINIPATNPSKDSLHFKWWSEGTEETTFPLEVTRNMTLNAIFSVTRDEVSASKAGTLITNTIGTKVADGLALYAVAPISMWKGTPECLMVVATSEEALAISGGSVVTKTTLEYRGITWYVGFWDRYGQPELDETGGTVEPYYFQPQKPYPFQDGKFALQLIKYYYSEIDVIDETYTG